MNKEKVTENYVLHVSGDLIIEKSKTGVDATNDFDLESDKIPPISTIKTQIKSAKKLIEDGITTTRRIEFDRLKIAVNLIKDGETIEFEDLWLEDVAEPERRPTYKYNADDMEESFSEENEEDEIAEDIDIDTFFDSEEFEIQAREVEEKIKLANEKRPNIFTSPLIKKRICYEEYKDCIGLNNLYINNGYFIVDITGKWMADKGHLGSLHRDNIKNALQKILDTNVVSFNIDLFLKYAQVFLCDVCTDIQMDSGLQCKRTIDGISSFFPLASNKYYINKYGRNGLTLIPKAKNKGYSLTVYHKGEELSNSKNRWTKAEKYTYIIGEEGSILADFTVRLEIKLQRFETIREVLGIENRKNLLVPLNDVLNSNTPVILKQFELFCGTPKVLLERLEWLQEVRENNNKLSFDEILISERIVELLKENNYDITILRNHIKTEYPNVKDSEIEKTLALGNLRKNILNFLVYHKPKSVTIMLDVLRRLYLYYSAQSTTGGTNGN